MHEFQVRVAGSRLPECVCVDIDAPELMGLSRETAEGPAVGTADVEYFVDRVTNCGRAKGLSIAAEGFQYRESSRQGISRTLLSQMLSYYHPFASSLHRVGCSTATG